MLAGRHRTPNRCSPQKCTAADNSIGSKSHKRSAAPHGHAAADRLRTCVPLSRPCGCCRSKFCRLIRRGTAADEHSVLGRLDDRARMRIQERQFIETEREIYRFRFTWIESNPRKPSETAHGL